jgi:hypothetical protein
MLGVELALIIGAWLLFFGCLGFFAYAFVEEAKWSARAKIGYRNFEQCEKYYSFKLRKLLYPLYGASVLLAVAFIIGLHLFGMNATRHLQVLNYVTILGIAITTLGVFISASKRQKNKDLSPVKALYEQIKSSFSNQAALESALKEFRLLHSQFLENNGRITARLDGITAKQGGLDLSGTLSDLEALIKDCEGRLGGFDNSLTAKFDAVLRAFLQSGQIETLGINTFLFGGMADMNGVKQKVVEKQKEVILSFALSVAANQNYAADESAVELYSVLDELKIEYTEALIADSFAYVDKHSRARAAVIKRVFPSVIFNAQIYCSFIVESHYFWLLEHEYALPQAQLIKVAGEMLAEDAIEYAQLFLMRLKDGALSILNAAVPNAKKDNKTRKLFILYMDIAAGSSKGGGNRAKASEDLYVVLDSFARRTDNAGLQNALGILRSAKSLDLNHAKFERLYGEILAKHNDLYETSLLTMLAFLNGGKAAAPFDKTAVVELFHEYKFTLSVDELQVLNLILIAALFIYESGQAEAQAQTLLAKQQSLFKNDALSNGLLAAQTKEQKAQAIIKALTKGQYARATLAVINRVEKERLL